MGTMTTLFRTRLPTSIPAATNGNACKHVQAPMTGFGNTAANVNGVFRRPTGMHYQRVHAWTRQPHSGMHGARPLCSREIFMQLSHSGSHANGSCTYPGLVRGAGIAHDMSAGTGSGMRDLVEASSGLLPASSRDKLWPHTVMNTPTDIATVSQAGWIPGQF